VLAGPPVHEGGEQCWSRGRKYAFFDRCWPDDPDRPGRLGPDAAGAARLLRARYLRHGPPREASCQPRAGLMLGPLLGARLYHRLIRLARTACLSNFSRSSLRYVSESKGRV
jgi:hypothetical protein